MTTDSVPAHDDKENEMKNLAEYIKHDGEAERSDAERFGTEDYDDERSQIGDLLLNLGWECDSDEEVWSVLARIFSEQQSSLLASARADGAGIAGLAPMPQIDRAQVITLCGSTKFKAAINAENARLTMEGNLVISLGLFGHTDLPDYNWDTDASDLKRTLDAIHAQKIDMADRVHVVNPGGYYGESTAREIAYARSHGKPVTFMEPDRRAAVPLTETSPLTPEDNPR